MGKQINYWMDYDSFLILVEDALKQGCEVYSYEEPKVLITDPSQIRKDVDQYYFHVPEAGEAILDEYGPENNRFWRFDILRSPTIAASFSLINDQNKSIERERLYVSTGYWDDEGQWIPRNDIVTKIYDHLARKVKKLCPYTELIDIRTKRDTGEEWKYIHKEYVSPKCLVLRETNDYKLRG